MKHLVFFSPYEPQMIPCRFKKTLDKRRH